MGTRNTLMVKSNNKLALSQYGQWDGYFSYMGRKVTEFVKNNFSDSTYGVNNFKEKLANLKIVDDDTANDLVEKLDEVYKSYELHAPLKHLAPTLSRDTGADILDIVQDSWGYTLPVVINDDFCYVEFVYLIDMDKKTLCCLTSHTVNKRMKVEVKNKWVKTLQKAQLQGFTCFMEVSFEELKDVNISKLARRYKNI